MSSYKGMAVDTCVQGCTHGIQGRGGCKAEIYKGLQRCTEVYWRIQRYTKDVQRYTREYREGCTEVYRNAERYTEEEYRGVQWRVYRGDVQRRNTGVYRGLERRITGMYRGIQENTVQRYTGCTKVYWRIQGCTREYRNVQSIQGVYRGILGMYRDILGNTGMYRGIQRGVNCDPMSPAVKGVMES